MSTKLMNYLNIGDDQFEVADAAARAGIGSPLVAATAADMTDTSKIYVYTGSETGYTAGNWYYYNGSAWTSGGIYNSAAVNVDTTLTVAGAAADAKVVGDKFDEVEADLANKANVDGAYENMTVGNAEQLISTVGEINKTPYLFRTSGGSIDIGDREVDKLVGGTVAFNQYATDNIASDTYADVSIVNNGNGSITLNGVSSGRAFMKNFEISPKVNHIYFLANGKGLTLHSTSWGLTIDREKEINISKCNSEQAGEKIAYEIMEAGISFNNKTVYPQIIDLTQMFGSTIANYIYSLEQSQAGDGVAWFRNLFGADYYAYNAGQLMSVKTSSHDMVGFNAYDNSTGKAKLVGGMEYQITGTYTGLSYSTGETITPDANGKFTPSANGELTVTGGNATDTCVHLVWDGERDDEYEEYKKTSYALDSDLELRGIPKLDASNNLYYDGDTYESDGTVSRRYDADTLFETLDCNWNYQSDYNYWYIDGSDYVKILGAIGNISDSLPADVLTLNYPIVSRDWFNSNRDNLPDKCISFGASGVTYLRDTSITSTSYNGAKPTANLIELVYLKATPTTESADPFTNPQAVDDFGTEEYVDSRTVPIPVGHDTMYQANLRAKLETAPNLPEANGLYLVKYENGDAVYQQYVAPSSPVPTLPTEDGTYSLKCTVADGTASLSWIADT